jgi:hypothetical protein
MPLPSLNALNLPLPDRKLKLFVVGIGLGFWLCWGTSLLLLVEGNPLHGMESCTPIDGTGVFFECSTDKFHTLLATSVNALIVVTLAMPMFVAVANIDPALVPLAMLGIVFHVVGLPAGLFVLVRSLRRLWEQASGHI